MPTKPDLEPDLRLTRMLKGLDKEHHFRRYEAGYHNGPLDDIVVEYGFEELRIFLPKMWRRPIFVTERKETLMLAYRRALGEKVPRYGSRALATLDYEGRGSANIFYHEYQNMDLGFAEQQAMGVSHWVISKRTGKRVLRRYDLERGCDLPIPKWDDYYAVL